MDMLLLAFKNLWRSKVRSSLTILSVVFGVMAYIFFMSFLQGTKDMSLQNLRDYETGYGQIIQTKYFDDLKNPSLEYTYDYSALKTELNNKKITFVPRAISQGEIIFYKQDGYVLDGSYKMNIVGMNSKYEEVPGLKQGINLKQAAMGDVDYVWISKFLAEKLKATLGSPLIISTKTEDGSYEAIDVKIGGIFETPDTVANMTQVYIGEKTVLGYLDVDLNRQATTLLFKTAKLKGVKAMPKGTQFYPWDVIGKDVVAISKFDSQRMDVTLTLIFIIIAIGIINTMIMNVYERFKEVGTLRAFGMMDREVKLMFTYEGLVIGILGSIIGLILGSITALPIIYHGIDFTSFIGKMNSGYRLPGIAKGAWPFFGMIKISFISILLCSVFAFLASRIATKKSIIECMKD